MKKPRNVIRHQLLKIRNEKGISQNELAAISQRKGWDISRNVLAKIETGARCVADFEVLLLAESLGVSAVALFPTSVKWNKLRLKFASNSE